MFIECVNGSKRVLVNKRYIAKISKRQDGFANVYVDGTNVSVKPLVSKSKYDDMTFIGSPCLSSLFNSFGKETYYNINNISTIEEMGSGVIIFITCSYYTENVKVETSFDDMAKMFCTCLLEESKTVSKKPVLNETVDIDAQLDAEIEEEIKEEQTSKMPRARKTSK